MTWEMIKNYGGRRGTNLEATIMLVRNGYGVGYDGSSTRKC